ncbi:eukaryotic aspartyl protease (macronuclear) [Tetrahymena thermophila SB210]|uniref:Eukaryotic aspartyl protease n=1 Tax=Tetrahymena thermophila (strain SB210) TaxID=312017 RepID=I7M820_TETTS|nr:eukaryotic aspartyl protease [Tetrahymena thermophila SB210]EAR96452.2 eukaryotic aspartyl protease [Tetrahymena thermophila SB210]|eukprot:XP_001016697.2 eukaryotic aspartyl protease [Tetrahymena thermophila SB210]
MKSIETKTLVKVSIILIFISNTFQIIAAQRLPIKIPFQFANNPSSKIKLSEADLRIKLICQDMQVSPLKNLKKKDDDDDDEDDDDDDKKKYRNEDYFLKQKDRTDLDFQYTTDFLIGSNKQKMTLLVDTGSQQSWIPTIDCNEKTCPKYSHWFNYSQSSSYSQRKITQKIEYLSGDIQGYEGKDLILFKDSQQGQILVPLLFAYKVDSFIFTNFDGVLGLPNKIKSDSLIDILYDQNLIDNPRFSIQIARFPEPSSDKTRVLDNKDYKNIIQKGDDDDDDDEDDNDNNKQEDNYLNDQYLNDKNSYLYIGQGIPKQILNKTNWVETTSSIQWKTILIGLYHNDNDLIDQLDSHNYDVYFESGTSLSLFPEEIKEYLEELLIKKGCDKKNNQVYCDCNSDNYPKLQFYLRGVKLIFDSNIYFNKTKLSQKKQCLFNVLTSPEDHNFIVFGNSLIRKYLLTFDKKEQKVGFYNSQLVKNESTGIILIFLVNIIILGGLLYVIYETVRQEKTIKGEEDEDQEVFFQELEIYSNRSSFNSTYSRMFNPTLLDEQSFNEGHRYCDMIKI